MRQHSLAKKTAHFRTLLGEKKKKLKHLSLGFLLEVEGNQQRREEEKKGNEEVMHREIVAWIAKDNNKLRNYSCMLKYM